VKTAIAAYRAQRADRVVAEANPRLRDGRGNLARDRSELRLALRAGPGSPPRCLTAQLDDQMCGFLPASHGDVDLRPDGYPADCVDALFWALTDLLLEPMSNRGIFDLYRQLAQESRS
jgi:phage terminase large subunit-like protein